MNLEQIITMMLEMLVSLTDTTTEQLSLFLICQKWYLRNQHFFHLICLVQHSNSFPKNHSNHQQSFVFGTLTSKYHYTTS